MNPATDPGTWVELFADAKNKQYTPPPAGIYIRIDINGQIGEPSFVNQVFTIDNGYAPSGSWDNVRTITLNKWVSATKSPPLSVPPISPAPNLDPSSPTPEERLAAAAEVSNRTNISALEEYKTLGKTYVADFEGQKAYDVWIKNFLEQQKTDRLAFEKEYLASLKTSRPVDPEHTKSQFAIAEAQRYHADKMVEITKLQQKFLGEKPALSEPQQSYTGYFNLVVALASSSSIAIYMPEKIAAAALSLYKESIFTWSDEVNNPTT